MIRNCTFDTVSARFDNCVMGVGLADIVDPQTDSIWILSSTFIIFTMQSVSARFDNCVMGVGLADIVDPQTDSIWILSSTFIIFTMQSGFGLLESGSVSVKNELNIMVKNAVDVVFGGITYWAFGYGLSFGENELSNPVVGWGNFFVTANDDRLGWLYSKFFFQASFATTATTIVSGAMAERTKLTSYMVFSMFNTVLFSIPAHWVWATKGWLYNLGVVDIAGAGPVHLVGGVTGLVATILLKPRYKRYKSSRPPQMSSPTNAVLGMFMLWWGWLGFNCGSTFGISGVKWKLAARSAASTLCSSVAGGVAGLFLSYVVKDRKFDVTFMINGILGSLVSVTAICALVQPWEGLIIGCIGSLLANGSVCALDRLKVDDPVGCVSTHALSGAWGLLAGGLFTRKDGLLDALYLHHVQAGLFYGGGFRQLGIQALAVLAITVWSIVISFIILKIIDCTMGLRVSLVEEIIGADIVEHGIGNVIYDRKTERLIYPEDENNDETIGNGDLASVHERELRAMRDRSLSRFSHLLGHAGRRRTANEINTEIVVESSRRRRASDNEQSQTNGTSESTHGLSFFRRIGWGKTRQKKHLNHINNENGIKRRSQAKKSPVHNGFFTTTEDDNSNINIAYQNSVDSNRIPSDISEERDNDISSDDVTLDNMDQTSSLSTEVCMEPFAVSGNFQLTHI